MIELRVAADGPIDPEAPLLLVRDKATGLKRAASYDDLTSSLKKWLAVAGFDTRSGLAP